MSPVYRFESPCGQMLSTSRPMDADTLHKTCDCCGLEARRIFDSFSFHRYQGGYNAAVGKEVTSERQFKEELKIASEEATQRTGMVHNFQPIDVREHQPKNLEALEDTHRAHRRLGLTEATKSYFTMPGGK